MMQKLNPSAQLLRPDQVLRLGQALKYRKAAMKKVVVGWKKMTTSNIGTVYNSGDSRYAKKLDYALALIRKGEVQLCVS